jgi:WD40 repeat protein
MLNKSFFCVYFRAGRLVICYLVSDRELPVIKDVLWHLEPTQQICCLCFDPSGTWLAVSCNQQCRRIAQFKCSILFAGCDSSLCIVPALALVDPDAALDLRWQTNDISKLLSTKLRPICTAIVWWHSLDGQHVAIMGSGVGQITFVSLTTGNELGRANVPGEIVGLHLCFDNSLDLVFLIVNISSGIFLQFFL